MAYIPTVWSSGDIVTSTKLNKIENGLESASEKELPSVSGTDNGYLLTVVEGAWTKAEPESSIFTITMTENSETQNLEIDKTFAQIIIAYNNNKSLILKHSTGDSVTINDTIYNLVHVETGGNDEFVLFMGNLYISADSVYCETVQINNDNTISLTECTYPGIS